MNMLKYNKNGFAFKKVMKPFMFLLTLLVLTGCNEDFPNLLKDKYPEDLGGKATQNSKVLLVIVDGVEGDILKGMTSDQVPVITEMNKNAIYSYNSLVDYNDGEVTNALGWTTLMTGVNSAKHGVKEVGDFASSNLEAYPTFISRIKALKPELHSAVYASSADFVSNLANEADSKASFSTDEETKNAVLTELGSDQADIVVAQFNGEGITHEDAIIQFDSYLGELKAGLESRKSYHEENWVVIVTSSKGGEYDGVKADKYDDKSRNIFTIIYAPRFSDRIVPKPLTGIPYIGNGMRFTFNGANKNKATVKNVDAFNFGVKPNVTMQLTIKAKPGVIYYPSFFSKRSAGFSGEGWNVFMSHEDAWKFNCNAANGEVLGAKVGDGEWHTITIVFDKASNKIKTYTDGVFNHEATMNDNSMDNASPLQLGVLEGDWDYSVLITNVQIFNTNLSDATIAAYACKPQINEDHPNWSNLIGYWPGDELGKTVMKERTGSKNDFVISGGLTWESFNEVAPNLCPIVKPEYFTIVPNSVDVSFQIYQWLGISTPQAWGLDGKGWTPSYTQIRP